MSDMQEIVSPKYPRHHKIKNAYGTQFNEKRIMFFGMHTRFSCESDANNVLTRKHNLAVYALNCIEIGCK